MVAYGGGGLSNGRSDRILSDNQIKNNNNNNDDDNNNDNDNDDNNDDDDDDDDNDADYDDDDDDMEYVNDVDSIMVLTFCVLNWSNDFPSFIGCHIGCLNLSASLNATL
ncbi:hypothetical protein M0804_005175 [Polistes exclamans]|nr:hypothetical protein M0804_005175 [Polistes exclamans]